ncbi:hypothetical protein GBA52_001048 [Prunus armeniaca]|nr:hypothetical protein GBA52_001048 [Prunus armeniaca]
MLVHRLLNDGDPVFGDEIVYATRPGDPPPEPIGFQGRGSLELVGSLCFCEDIRSVLGSEARAHAVRGGRVVVVVVVLEIDRARLGLMGLCITGLRRRGITSMSMEESEIGSLRTMRMEGDEKVEVLRGYE